MLENHHFTGENRGIGAQLTIREGQPANSMARGWRIGPMSGVSKSQVSRLCGEIDDKVNGFLDRSLEGDWPYLWLDATYVKVREAGRIRLGRGDRGCGRSTTRAAARSGHGDRRV